MFSVNMPPVYVSQKKSLEDALHCKDDQKTHKPAPNSRQDTKTSRAS